ncbi:MAG TPA: hypothetical protein PKW64_08785 [Segatella copri]|nr:hypothetical protein [Segatella copri]
MQDKEETPVKGALIYQPQGAAGEYAKWAINLYNGCYNGCTYCYNRRGVLSHIFGDKPELAAPIVKSRDRQINYFLKRKKLTAHDPIPDVAIENCTNVAICSLIYSDTRNIGIFRLIEDGGVFMSFTCDPLDTDENVQHYTFVAAQKLLGYGIPVTLLTKNVAWLKEDSWKLLLEEYPKLICCQNHHALLTIGFTITGKDKLEPNAPSTEKRIEVLRKLHDEYKIKTFVSLEPITSIHTASEVIKKTYQITDEIRIGAQSPIKKDRYDPNEFFGFITAVKFLARDLPCCFMVKDSMYKQAETFEDTYRDMCIAKLDEIREIYNSKQKE